MASKHETDSDTQDISIISHVINAKPTEKKVMVNCASQSMSSPPGRDSLDSADPTSSPPPPRQILNRSTTRSSSSSFSESLDPALDPSSLPPPDPWLDSGNNSSVPQSGGGGTLCRRDGQWFLKLLQAETGRMEGWCQQMEQETKDNQLSEEGKDGRVLTVTQFSHCLSTSASWRRLQNRKSRNQFTRIWFWLWWHILLLSGTESVKFTAEPMAPGYCCVPQWQNYRKKSKISQK